MYFATSSSRQLHCLQVASSALIPLLQPSLALRYLLYKQIIHHLTVLPSPPRQRTCSGLCSSSSSSSSSSSIANCSGKRQNSEVNPTDLNAFVQIFSAFSVVISLPREREQEILLFHRLLLIISAEIVVKDDNDG